MNKFKLSAIFSFFALLALVNIQTNCQENGFDKLLKAAEKKPYYTALLVYTALWAKNNLDEYSQKHTGALGWWIAYLVARGYSQDDVAIWEPFLWMPGKGILVN